MDNLGFVIARSLVRKIVTILKMVSKVVLQQGKDNLVTYDIKKIELMLFSKIRLQQYKRQVRKTKVVIVGKYIKFKKKATR